jgi:hypothetical protein
MTFVELAISAVLWATFATVISQLVGIAVMWALGLPPRKLVAEIVDVQNPAVGATFFIISLTASIFVSVLSGGPPTVAEPLETALWIIGGLLLAVLYTTLAFAIAHRLMGVKDEGLYKYIRRELISEQNAALAFFLGGLAVAPFIAILYQIQ